VALVTWSVPPPDAVRASKAVPEIVMAEPFRVPISTSSWSLKGLAVRVALMRPSTTKFAVPPTPTMDSGIGTDGGLPDMPRYALAFRPIVPLTPVQFRAALEAGVWGTSPTKLAPGPATWTRSIRPSSAGLIGVANVVVNAPAWSVAVEPDMPAELPVAPGSELRVRAAVSPIVRFRVALTRSPGAAVADVAPNNRHAPAIVASNLRILVLLLGSFLAPTRAPGPRARHRPHGGSKPGPGIPFGTLPGSRAGHFPSVQSECQGRGDSEPVRELTDSRGFSGEVPIGGGVSEVPGTVAAKNAASVSRQTPSA